MTKEDEQYFDNYFDLFGTKGWTQLIEDLQDRLDVYNIDYLNSEKDLFTAKGEIAVLKGVVGFEAFIRHSFENSEKA